MLDIGNNALLQTPHGYSIHASRQIRLHALAKIGLYCEHIITIVGKAIPVATTQNHSPKRFSNWSKSNVDYV